MATLLEEVNKPTHYRSHESGIEAIEVTRCLIGDLSNAWKYAMRYDCKGTPKKDLLKLCWYLKDWYNHFLDENNNDIAQTPVEPYMFTSKMLTIIDKEPVPQIKNILTQIYRITIDGGLINPKAFLDAVADIEKFAETFS
jgi:hypothetical protein